MMSEHEIISGLMTNGKHHDQALAYLYSSPNYQEPIKLKLKSKGVTPEDADVIWVDVVTRFATLVRTHKYEDQRNLLGYLHNLSRYLMLNYFKDKKRISTLELSESDASMNENGSFGFYNRELKELLSRELSKIGESCHKILELWSQSFSMKEISEELKIVSVEATRKRKHICLKKLLTNIEAQFGLKSTLKSYMELF